MNSRKNSKISLTTMTYFRHMLVILTLAFMPMSCQKENLPAGFPKHFLVPEGWTSVEKESSGSSEGRNTFKFWYVSTGLSRLIDELEAGFQMNDWIITFDDRNAQNPTLQVMRDGIELKILTYLDQGYKVLEITELATYNLTGVRDRRDKGLATLVNEAAKSIAAAASGAAHDPTFDSPSGDKDLRSTPSDVVLAVRNLDGQLKVVCAVLELEALTDDKAYIRSNCAVFADGRVAWLKIEGKQSDYVEESSGLTQAAPELADAIDRMLEALQKSDEALPLVGVEQQKVLPWRFRKLLLADASSRSQAALFVQKRDGAAWRPRVDDITVVAKTSGTYPKVVALKSGFSIESGRLVLYRPSFREIN